MITKECLISQPLRVYRGVHTKLDEDIRRLLVPPTTRNFLISPPGSPPIGWEHAEEDPPNSAPLAADLLAALQRLQLNRARPTERLGVQLLMAPDDDDMVEDATDTPSSKPGLTIYLEDSDFKQSDAQDGSGTLTPMEDGLWQGERMYGGIGSVKASVASMWHDVASSPRSPRSAGSGKVARVSTPRPPLADET